MITRRDWIRSNMTEVVKEVIGTAGVFSILGAIVVPFVGTVLYYTLKFTFIDDLPTPRSLLWAAIDGAALGGISGAALGVPGSLILFREEILLALASLRSPVLIVPSPHETMRREKEKFRRELDNAVRNFWLMIIMIIFCVVAAAALGGWAIWHQAVHGAGIIVR